MTRFKVLMSSFLILFICLLGCQPKQSPKENETKIISNDSLDAALNTPQSFLTITGWVRKSYVPSMQNENLEYALITDEKDVRTITRSGSGSHIGKFLLFTGATNPKLKFSMEDYNDLWVEMTDDNQDLSELTVYLQGEGVYNPSDPNDPNDPSNTTPDLDFDKQLTLKTRGKNPSVECVLDPKYNAAGTDPLVITGKVIAKRGNRAPLNMTEIRWDGGSSTQTPTDGTFSITVTNINQDIILNKTGYGEIKIDLNEKKYLRELYIELDNQVTTDEYSKSIKIKSKGKVKVEVVMDDTSGPKIDRGNLQGG